MAITKQQTQTKAPKNSKKINLPQLTVIEKQAILKLLVEGKTGREIERMGLCSRSTACRIYDRFLKTRKIFRKKGSGRPRKTNKKIDDLIEQKSENDRLKVSSQIRDEIAADTGVRVSGSTIRRRLVERGLFGRIAKKKPLQSDRNIARRLAWAEKHRHWTKAQWRKVLWTDESKFELFNTKRRQHCRRRQGEPLQKDTIKKTVKHGGGSIMVWGCFQGNKTGDLVKIEGILVKEKMHQILVKHAVPSGQRLIGKGFILQQDNDPKHTSKICQNYLKKKEQEGVLVNMDWPAQSPDLNPIEKLWEEIDRQMEQQGKPTSLPGLWETVQNVWKNLDGKVLEKLVDRMPETCRAVIEAKGGAIDEKTDVRRARKLMANEAASQKPARKVRNA